MFESFQKFVMASAARNGMLKPMTAAQICRIFRELRDEVWPQARDFVDALHFSDGVLEVSVAGSAWAQEVRMKEGKLIQALNERLGRERVKKMEVKAKG